MYRCENCGWVDWSTRPTLKAVLDRMAVSTPYTTREIADWFEWSAQNAHNKLKELQTLGYVRSEEMRPHPTGGLQHVWVKV